MQKSKRPVLCLFYPDEASLEQFGQQFDLTAGGTQDTPPQAVVTTERCGFPDVSWDQWPEVRLIHFYGTGCGNIDLELARRHGAYVTTAAGAHSACVADHAMALFLSVLRCVPRLDRHIRQGGWLTEVPLMQLSGRSVGLIGFGSIGQLLAARLAGFESTVGYFSRNPKVDRPERYFDNLRDLAHWADDLIIALPGGRETHHLVDATVINALGQNGNIVNIGRGSVIDTAALTQALAGGRIAGAGLDVLEGEPEVPAALLALPNVVLTPHVGGLSPQSRDLLVRRTANVLEEFFAGRSPSGSLF